MKLSSVLSFLAAALVAANPSREKTLKPRYRVVPSDLPNPGRPKEAHIWDHNAHLYGDYTFYCGVFSTGAHNNLRVENIERQELIWTIEPGSCARVFCWNTSAIYVCNNRNDESLGIPSKNIGWMAERLLTLCCSPHEGGTSGQLFHPTEGYNVVIGYGNCNNEGSYTPDHYVYPGPNGECQKYIEPALPPRAV